MAAGLLDPYSAQSAGGGLKRDRNEGYPSSSTAWGTTTSPQNPVSPSATEAFKFWGAPVFKNAYGELYCPGYTGETYARNSWELLQLCGYKMPGLWEITIDRSLAVDEKKAAGQSGARLTLHGLNQGRVDLRGTIWTPEQLRQLGNIWTKLFPGPGQAAKDPIAIVHPKAAFHQVRAVQLIGATGPDLAGPGQRTFTIRAVEYIPIKRANRTKTSEQWHDSTLDPATVPTPGSNVANRGP